MSLHKTYRVQCEGISLARRLDRRWFQGDHWQYGPPTDSAATARRQARSVGFQRVTKTLPVAGGTDTTDVRFDLCPSCARLFDR